MNMMNLKEKLLFLKEKANFKLGVAGSTFMALTVPAFAVEPTPLDLTQITTAVGSYCTPANVMTVAAAGVGIAFLPALANWGTRRVIKAGWKGLTKGKVSF